MPQMAALPFRRTPVRKARFASRTLFRRGGGAGRRLAGMVLGVCLAFVALTPAEAQNADVRLLLNRIDRLERDVQTLSRQVYRGEAPSGQTATGGNLSGSYGTQVEVRLQELERQIQLLTGRVEELRYANEQLSSRLDRAMNDIEFRLSSLEGGTPPEGAPGAGAASGPPASPDETTGAGATGRTATTEGTLGTLSRGSAAAPPAAGGPTASGPVQPVALPEGPAETQYNYAYSLLAQGNYAQAESALSQFLETNPDAPLASNAQYWLGETYYIRGRFNDAAIAFAQGYQNYPDGAKAVDSLLKLGMSLSAMGKTEDACLTFSQLRNEFPQAPSSITRRAAQEQDRLQCG